MKKSARFLALVMAMLMLLVGCAQNPSTSVSAPQTDAVKETEEVSASISTGNEGKEEEAPAVEEPAEEAEESALLTEEEVGKKRVVLLVKQLANTFFTEFVEYATKKCDEYGWDIEVLRPTVNNNNEEQIQLVDQALLNPPDIFLIMPAEPAGFVPAVEKINEAGIPLINVDDQIKDESVEITTFIGADHYELGKLMGTSAVELSGIENAKCLVIEGTTGSYSSITRYEGLKDALEGTGWEIVDSQPGNYSRADSFNVVQNLLQKHDDIDFIFFISATMALGAHDAVVNSGQDIKCATVDTNKEVLELIQNSDHLMFTCDNAAWLQGYTSVELAMKYFQGEQLDEQYMIAGACVYPEAPEWAEYAERYGLAS